MFLNQYIPLRILSIYSIPQSTFDFGYIFFFQSLPADQVAAMSLWQDCSDSTENILQELTRARNSEYQIPDQFFPYHSASHFICALWQASRSFQDQSDIEFPLPHSSCSVQRAWYNFGVESSSGSISPFCVLDRVIRVEVELHWVRNGREEIGRVAGKDRVCCAEGVATTWEG